MIYTERPWGWYEMLGGGSETAGFKLKRICVKPGKRISLQSHKFRSEHWVIIKGAGKVTLGSTEFNVSPNQHVFIPVGEIHRIENIGTLEDLIFIETQTGTYFGEDDIVRYDDDFGRL